MEQVNSYVLLLWCEVLLSTYGSQSEHAGIFQMWTISGKVHVQAEQFCCVDPRIELPVERANLPAAFGANLFNVT